MWTGSTSASASARPPSSTPRPRSPRSPPPPSMPEARVVESLRTVDRGRWNALFPGDLDDYDYLLAVEQAGIANFRWRYVLVSEGDALLAAAPAFLTEYGLETTLLGAGKRLAEGLRRLAPGALRLRLACIGSPCTATAHLGFAPQVAEADRPGLLRELLAAFEREAAK